MANIKSQIKRNRQNEKRRLMNKAIRSEIHTRSKSAVEFASDEKAESEQIDQSLITAVKCIDKAAAKGVIHKNTAARKKSRLIAQIKKQKNAPRT